VLRSDVGIVCEMEAGTVHSSARFKQRAVIEFLKEWQPTKRECIFMNPKPNVSPQNTIRNVHVEEEKTWAGNVIATGFWDAYCVIDMVFLEPGTTINIATLRVLNSD